MNLDNSQKRTSVLQVDFKRSLYAGNVGGTIQQLSSPSSSIFNAGINPEDVRDMTKPNNSELQAMVDSFEGNERDIEQANMQSNMGDPG